jgi:hypothetical protein
LPSCSSVPERTSEDVIYADWPTEWASLDIATGRRDGGEWWTVGHVGARVVGFVSCFRVFGICGPAGPGLMGSGRRGGVSECSIMPHFPWASLVPPLGVSRRSVARSRTTQRLPGLGQSVALLGVFPPPGVITIR